MNSFRHILLLALALAGMSARGQNVPFTSDLPGTTGGSDVLPKGRFQWETTVGVERDALAGPINTIWTLNSSLLRLGMTDTAELRLQADYLYSVCDGTHMNGLSNVAIGTKLQLFRSKKQGPNLALLANVYVPGGKDSHFLPSEWGGQLALLLDYRLNSWMSLCGEGDMLWMGEAPTYFYGLGLNFDLSDRCFLAVDEYNETENGDTDCWLALSFAFQLAPRLLLDISTDFSLKEPANYQNLMIGVAWQITE